MATHSPGPIPITHEPPNAETPLAELRHRVTPADVFYVRSHFPVPAIDPATWSVRLGGAVRRPLRLSLPEVAALPSRTVRVTLECAGNGRKGMRPTPPGTPWGLGAAGTAEFTGTPLRALLEDAGVMEGAAEVLFRGADHGADGTRCYERSLPLESALDPDTLLCWEMNGQPLAPLHGAPLRLVVPGWYAMASVKWLAEIEVLTEPFRGFYQRRDYVYLDEEGTPQATPVTRMRVRSLILHPPPEAVLGPDVVEVAGVAWSGSGPIAAVEVSTDGGMEWRPARVEEPGDPFAAQRWWFAWRPAAPGEYTLLARATDVAARRQPLRAPWNRLGYGNNACQAVTVSVR
ncbi:MAG TPA: sulfite oxidase [Longimicrobium sp.]